MTRVYFVRHAQSDYTCKNTRIRPLTPQGLIDRKKVTELLTKLPVDCFYSSPYKRAYDTIADCAETLGMDIKIDERFSERLAGENGYSIELTQKRWSDFNFCEPGGESLSSCQRRNIEALNEVLTAHEGKNIVIGTHGTALSTILNYYDPGYGFSDFVRIQYWMPYVIQLDFLGLKCIDKQELLIINRPYET